MTRISTMRMKAKTESQEAPMVDATNGAEAPEDGDDAEVVDPALPSSDGDLPPLDFSTFIVSLRASAVMHLEGDADEGVGLALAHQEIDLLGLLEDKTRGNLTGDEERLLSQILFDLRTRYVAVRDRLG
jgi:hypothetical protein